MVLIGIPLVAILLPAFLTWAKDLNPIARRVRQLDEQSKLIDFWDNWIKTISSTLPSIRHKDKTEGITISLLNEARVELLYAGRNVLSLYRADELRDYREFKLSFAEFQKYRANLSWFRRAFLLYKSPNRSAKYAKRMFYWYVLAPYIVASIEIPLINHFYPSPRTHYLLIFGSMTLTHLIRAILHVLVYVIAILFLLIPPISSRNRAIRFEDDPTEYVYRKKSRYQPIDQEF